MDNSNPVLISHATPPVLNVCKFSSLGRYLIPTPPPTWLLLGYWMFNSIALPFLLILLRDSILISVSGQVTIGYISTHSHTIHLNVSQSDQLFPFHQWPFWNPILLFIRSIHGYKWNCYRISLPFFPNSLLSNPLLQFPHPSKSVHLITFHNRTWWFFHLISQDPLGISINFGWITRSSPLQSQHSHQQTQ